jgi:deoxycytidylate deaminase
MCAKRMIKKGVKKVRFVIEKDDETIDFYEANLIHILEFTRHSTGKRLQNI